MNHIYRSIWSEALASWIAVSENTKGKAKSSSARHKLLATGLLLCSSTSWALPTGEQVVAGQVAVTTPATGQMQINQGSQQAIVNWQGFSINPNEAVNIYQPNANATLLNRVVGQDASVIQGQLHANGQVFLVNPNGVLFSKTAQVDVGGLVASTININNADFLSGKYHFNQDNIAGLVGNEGYLKTFAGGVVALIGTQVSNSGTIATSGGSTALVAGKTVDLDFKGDGLVEVKVPEAALNAKVENNGAILADGGRVVLTAKAAGQLVDTVLNTRGLVQVHSLANRNGEIILDGGNNGVTAVSGILDVSSSQAGGTISVTGKNVNVDANANLNAQTINSGKAGTIKVLADMNNGVLNVAGKLDASATKQGDGGFIETSAAQVKVADSAKISTKAVNGKTGTWLIDPNDYTVAAKGGDITGAILGANLDKTSITISTATQGTSGGNGDITVKDSVVWFADTLLTLSADRNIEIEANLTGKGTASQLALKYGQADAGGEYRVTHGSKVSLPAGANFSTQSGSAGTVKTYTVITELGAQGSVTATDLQGMNGSLTTNYALGADIDASPTNTWNFNGVLEGFLPVGNSTASFTGNFAGLGHTITGLTISRPTTDNVGLFGLTASNTISDVGLLGGNISGFKGVGALVGVSGSNISNVYATTDVTGNERTGGLVGENDSNINISYATGNVASPSSTGGLVGFNAGIIQSAYASGSVTGIGTNTNQIGGLVGGNVGTSAKPSKITNSYATGKVTGTAIATDISNNVGGLIGRNSFGVVTNSYATGLVTGTNNVGGLVGWNQAGSVSYSFWDVQTTGKDAASGVGLNNATFTAFGASSLEMMSQASYPVLNPPLTTSGWDFSNIWWISEGNTRPFLRMEFSSEINNNHQLQLMAMKPNESYTLANNLDLTTDLANPSGMWGGQSTGFVPIGDATTPFKGEFDGLSGGINHTITGLSIIRPTTDNVALFGYTGGGVSISNIGLIGGSITGQNNVGSLVGNTSFGDKIINASTTGRVTGTTSVGGLIGYCGYGCSIENSYSTGNVDGTNSIGGLAGNSYNSISNSFAIGNITGSNTVGGLVGYNAGNIVNNSYFSGNVSGATQVGGLVGSHTAGIIGNTHSAGNVTGTVDSTGGLVGSSNSTITNSYSTSRVTGTAYVGGLVGNNTNAINNSYATGSVASTAYVGGLIGWNQGNISNIYATGDVTGTDKVGGLIGKNESTVTNAYATGLVIGTANVGGLIGFNATGVVNNSFWDSMSTGQLGSAGGIGKTTDELKQFSTFSSWNGFTIPTISRTGINGATWRIYEGHTMPLLTSFLTSLTLDAPDDVKVYNGSLQSGTSITPPDLSNIFGATATGTNVGFYNGYYSNQQGYNIIGGNLIITPAILNAISLNGTRSYDGTTDVAANIFALSGLLGSDDLALSGIGSITSKNVGVYNTINLGSLALGDGTIGRASNYTLSGGSYKVIITPKALTVSAAGIDKVYDGTNVATVSLSDNRIAGDLLDLSNSTANFGTKDVGTDKTISININVTGKDANNYNFNLFGSALANITPRNLTVRAIGEDKVYDGSNFATVTFNDDRISGDVLSITNSNASFTDRNAGYEKTINVSGINVTGSDARNYIFNTNASTYANISPANLLITANSFVKPYDGLPYYGGNGVSYQGFVSEESSKVLSGRLSYSGNSQGAVEIGSYDIKPFGLSSQNYDIVFNDGILDIRDDGHNVVEVIKNLGQQVANNNIANLVASVIAHNEIDINPRGQTNDPALSHPIIADLANDFADTPATSSPAPAPAPGGEVKTVIPTLSVKNSAGQIKDLAMSADNQFMSLLLEDGTVRVWDFQKGVQRQILQQDKSLPLTNISSVNETGDVLSIANGAGIGIYDVVSLTTNGYINEPNINRLVASKDGKTVLVSTTTDKLSLWNSARSQKLWERPYERGVVNNLVMTSNKRYGAVLSSQHGAYQLPTDLQLKPLVDAVDIVDLQTGKLVKSLPNIGEQVVYINFQDNDTLSLGLGNGEVLNMSVIGNDQKTIANFAENLTALSKSGDTYSYVLKDGSMRVTDAQGNILLSAKNRENPFKDAKLLENGKKMLAVMANGDLSLWDVASGKKMLRLFSSKQGWVVMDAFGRFDGSEEAIENFSWVADDESIPLDNFSENYYEPGLLSSVLQNNDYLNRNSNAVRAGISLPPKVALQLAEQQATGDNVTVQMDVYDRGSSIDEINIYHNGKLLNNDNVISAQKTIKEDEGEHRALTLNITPSAGKNTLKIVASNSLGIENDSSEISFDGKTKAFTSSVKLLTVGVNRYSDANLNLDYSVADATSIGQAMRNNSKIVESKSLFDENATKAKILAELKNLSQGAQQDVLVIYLAGHGLVVGKEWYFLPYETKLQPTLEEIAVSGVTATELSNIFKSSKIQHILLMVDSCHSGAAMDAFSKLQNGQRYFTRQLSRNLGITVLTATSKDQRAAEMQSLGHGLFTYLMTQELENKNSDKPATAHSVAEKIVKALPIFSKKMIGLSQEPVAYTHGSDFILTDAIKESKNTAPDSLDK